MTAADRQAHILSELKRIPQPNARAYHAAPVKSVLIDIEVTRDELLGLLPLHDENLEITFNLVRDQIVFRRVEQRQPGFELRHCRRT